MPLNSSIHCFTVLSDPPQYFSVLLLILITQFAAGALIYFQKDVVSDVSSNIANMSNIHFVMLLFVHPHAVINVPTMDTTPV